MKNAFFAGSAVGVVLLAVSSVVFAHHNTLAKYDHDRPITLQGTVTVFRMISPHSHLEFEVKQADGAVVKWEAEGGSPASAYRRGWRTGDLKPGDTVTVTGSPAVDGSRWMEIKKLVTPSGKELE
jgi:hypothetical protein